MNIGKPKRTFEVVPITIPVPEQHPDAGARTASGAPRARSRARPRTAAAIR